MAAAPHFTEFVSAVVVTARDFTPRETVELGVIHGLCVDAANDHAPDMLDFLATVDSLAALAGALGEMTHLVVATDVSESSWRFVRIINPESRP